MRRVDSGRMAKWGCVVLALGALAACKTASSPAAAPASAAAPAATAADHDDPSAQLEAEGTIPEPEEAPCKNCSVNIARRVSGSFQPVEKCGVTGEPVVFPLTNPIVEVISGEQEGSQFELVDVPSSFDAGSTLDATVPEEAKPELWTEARILVEDGAGNTCSSMLQVLQ